MRYLVSLVCVLALGVMGCNQSTAGPIGGSGGMGGTDGAGGTAGSGGTGGVMECFDDEQCNDGNQCTEGACTAGICEFAPVEDGTECEDGNECTVGACLDGACNSTPVENETACDQTNECTVGVCSDGVCASTPVTDGIDCAGNAGICQQGSCQVACTEQGILDVVAKGGGPYTFECTEPTIVTTQAEIVIGSDLILDGQGLLTVDGDDDHRVFFVPGGSRAELRGLTVARGANVSEGGGIFSEGDLVLLNCQVRGSAATVGGGGIWSGAGATLTIKNSTVTGNTAKFGGGIRNTGVWGILTNSTVSKNTGHEGGGIHGDAASLTLINSTVSENSADYGSAIFYENNGNVTLSNSTVSGNVHAGGPVSFVIRATVMDGMCTEVVGEMVRWTSEGYNIASSTCGFDQETDQVNVSAEDLKLGELADNGGPTETRALGEGSFAIDQIPADDCEVETDQRGEPRDSMCDVGAFEVQP